MKRALLLGLLAWTLAAFAGPPAAIDRAQAKRLGDSTAHAQPTIVALWSSECVHCKDNLARFAELARQHPGLRLVTVAAEAAVPELAVPLDRLAVPGERYAWGSEAPEALAYAIDPKWRGELPRSLFFDGRGTRTAISGRVDDATARRLLGL